MTGQEKLESAAVELFGEKGYDGTSMRDIAARAEMSLGAVYRYHKSKHALARSLMVETHAKLARLVSDASERTNTLDSAIEHIIDGYLHLADQDWPRFRVYLINFHRFTDLAGSAGGSPVQNAAKLVSTFDRSGPPPIVKASMALGVVMQVALAKSYGQIEGPLSRWRDDFITSVKGVLYV